MNKLNSKSNNMMGESRSIDFQVTYIERKQDSFYMKGSITNNTNFLKSGNVTEANLQGYGGGGTNNVTANNRNMSKFIN